MELEIWKYCSKCDICRRTKAPRHDKHGPLHPVESACKPWTHIGSDFTADLPASDRATMIPVAVDRFTKMENFIPINNTNSPTVARANLVNV